MTEKHEPAAGTFDASEEQLVLSSLEPDQLAESKRQRLPKRRLKRGEVFVLMTLRIYLLFMTVVVIYQILHGVR